MQKREKRIRFLFAAFFGSIVAVLLGAAVFGMVSAGTLFAIPAAFGFSIATFPKFQNLLFQRNKILRRILIIAIALGLALIFVLLSLMVWGAARPMQESIDAVIVLGCQVRGDAPSRMLARRCYAALQFLESNPNCVVVATGGLGRHATISEAEAIRRYLVAHGIDDSRIFIEDSSTNTDENLRFAASILAENGIGGNVAIATDSFHQYRAGRFAARYGLTSSPLNCRTPFGTRLTYWCRELIAVLRFLLLGY